MTTPLPEGTRGAALMITGAAVLTGAVFLFVMSNRTGETEYKAERNMLDDFALTDGLLDASLFPLMFEFRTDVDALTAAERDLVARANVYAGVAPSAYDLRDLVAQKVALVEDFKSQQAVARNSRAIATEMLAKLWQTHATAPTAAQRELFRVERAFLSFVSRRDPPSAAMLVATIEAQNTAAAHAWTADQDWVTFAAHATTLARYSNLLGATMAALYAIPVHGVRLREEAAAQARYATATKMAARYRLALLVVALALLVFSGLKVWQIRTYVHVIRRANEELERRVETRTQELVTSNEALQTQMREREEIEAQLRLAQKLESIGQLAAGIAHEINTPTQYVSDNVAFLATAWQDLKKLVAEYDLALRKGHTNSARSERLWRDADVDYLLTEVPQAIDQVGSGLQQISRIVRAMKDFSHPGSEGLQPTDVNRAIESTATVARNEWRYVAELTLELDPNLPAVPCNVSALNQVILNILVNAAQAIGEQRKPGEQGRIWISSGCSGAHARIAIEDDGPGIPPAIRDKVFDPFFTTKPVGKGTGQGLAIAYRVVNQQHGGRLSVTEGRDGRGTKFVIELPLSNIGAAAQPMLATAS